MRELTKPRHLLTPAAIAGDSGLTPLACRSICVNGQFRERHFHPQSAQKRLPAHIQLGTVLTDDALDY